MPNPQFDIKKMVDDQKLKAKEDQIEKISNNLVDIQSKVYDKATAYTNLIILGGYAGAFTIWNFTRMQLPARANLCIAVLLGISLCTFIFFEVYKMAVLSIHFIRIRNLISDASDPDKFQKHFKSFSTKMARKGLSFILPWAVTLAVCVVTALAALGLLFYNYFALLFGFPIWPS